MTVPWVGNLYKVNMDTPPHNINLSNMPIDVAEVNNITIDEFWGKLQTTNELLVLHYKLGHPSEKLLREAIKRGAYKEISPDILKFPRCTICEMAKSKKWGHPKKSDNPASSVLETVVGDTSGLQTICTPAGNRGYSVLVDAKSQYIDVELLKSAESC